MSQCLYNDQKIKSNVIKITMSGSWAESVAANTNSDVMYAFSNHRLQENYVVTILFGSN